MAITNVVLTSTQSTLIFQAGLNEEYAITTMFFCNNTNSTLTDALINIYIVPAGNPSGASTNTMVINSLSLPRQETFVFDAEKLILANTDAIYARSTVANAVVATVSTVKTS
jgi:hypothetical protein